MISTEPVIVVITRFWEPDDYFNELFDNRIPLHQHFFCSAYQDLQVYCANKIFGDFNSNNEEDILTAATHISNKITENFSIGQRPFVHVLVHDLAIEEALVKLLPEMKITSYSSNDGIKYTYIKNLCVKAGSNEDYAHEKLRVLICYGFEEDPKNLIEKLIKMATGNEWRDLAPDALTTLKKNIPEHLEPGWVIFENHLYQAIADSVENNHQHADSMRTALVAWKNNFWEI